MPTTDNISMDNVSWQITDNTSMVFNWVNDNGTSFDNITFYPEQLLFSSGKFTALGRSSYTGENQAKAVIQSNDGLNWNLLTPVLKTQPIVLDNGTFQNKVFLKVTLTCFLRVQICFGKGRRRNVI